MASASKYLIVLFVPAFLHAQHAAMPAGRATTDAQKIASAMSAAPDAVARNATIMDWPAAPNGSPRPLRAGTNGWVCYPSTPTEFGRASAEDPMCFDKSWQAWGEAWTRKTPPKVSRPGIAYMLRGDKGVSNSDPFATAPTATNHWVVSPPHIMVLYADTAMLSSFPTDPNNGGPWVMWKGTPYAHLMVPVAPQKGVKMTARVR